MLTGADAAAMDLVFIYRYSLRLHFFFSFGFLIKISVSFTRTLFIVRFTFCNVTNFCSFSRSVFPLSFPSTRSHSILLRFDEMIALSSLIRFILAHQCPRHVLHMIDFQSLHSSPHIHRSLAFTFDVQKVKA